MIRRLAKTDPRNFSAFLLRIALGAVMFPHGAQKLFGWFGGYGFSATMGFMTEKGGLPWVVGFLVIMAESVGAVLLILGFLGRFQAFAIGLVMAGAVFVHLDYGFFMNWSGKQGGEGYEYHILAIAAALSLMITGSGKWSVDAALSRRKLR